MNKHIPVIIGIFLLSGCQSQFSLEARNKAIVKRYVDELLNKRDYSKAHEIITPDFTLYDNGLEVQQRGVDLFRMEDENEDSERLSELVLTIKELIAEGNNVAMLWYDTALYTPEKSSVDSPKTIPLKWYGMSLYRFRDGHQHPAKLVSPTV